MTAAYWSKENVSLFVVPSPFFFLGVYDVYSAVTKHHIDHGDRAAMHGGIVRGLAMWSEALAVWLFFFFLVILCLPYGYQDKLGKTGVIFFLASIICFLGYFFLPSHYSYR